MEDKKQYILKKVGRLYLKFGIRSVTMDDVASEFGISKKTLYQYFEDKADLVSQVVDYYLQNPVFDVNTEKYENPIDRYFAIRVHLNRILKYFNNNIEFDLKKHYPHLHAKVYKMKRDKIFSNTVKSLKDGMKKGVFRKDLDVDLIAKLQVGRMLYTLNPENKIFTESEVAHIHLFDRVMDYHMHAICTEEGIKYYKKQLNKVRNEDQN